MKVKITGSIEGRSDSGYFWSLPLRDSSVALPLKSLMDPQNLYDPDGSEPRELEEWPGRWVYRRRILCVEGALGVSPEELVIRIKHAVLTEDKRFAKLAREVEAFENFDRSQTARRERISDSVRIFVWQRDEGKCAKCGSRERLEFDHIIPVARGGSSTERNIQLLCEECNRSKGVNI